MSFEIHFSLHLKFHKISKYCMVRLLFVCISSRIKVTEVLTNNFLDFFSVIIYVYELGCITFLRHNYVLLRIKHLI